MKLYGAILGDLAGQPYEFDKSYKKTICLHNSDSHFTDDTIMTLATAYAILNKKPYFDTYKYFGKKYIGDYYGKRFKGWINGEEESNSWGNGCIMRLSPILYYNPYDTEDIYFSCTTSHNHVRSLISCYKLSQAYLEPELVDNKPIIPFTKFEVAADKTVNFCINLANQVKSTREAIIKAVECGGDTDTNASIVGELCNHRYNDLTKEDIEYVESKLDDFLLTILKDFNNLFK